MEKKKLILLKNLIDSDFLILQSKNQLFNSRYTHLKYNSYKTIAPFLVMDPIEIIKELKQTIRILQFLRKQNKKMLTFYSENQDQIDFVKSFFDKNNSFSHPISFRTKCFHYKTLKKTSQVHFILGNFFNFALINKLFSSNSILINKINYNREIHNLGTYKIHNDLANFKKLTFLIILLKKFYQTKI